MKNKTQNLIRRTSSLLLTGVVLFWFTGIAVADQYDDQINALNASISASQGQIAELNNQQNTLANKIASLNAEINAVSSQLRLSRLKQQQIEAQIAQAEKDMVRHKEILGENVRILYQQSSVSTLEMLASSNSFGEFLDRQQYLESVRDQAIESIDAVAAIKKQLEQQRLSLADLIASQQSQQDELAAKRAEQSTLMAQSQGQEAQYQQMVATNQKKLAEVKAARAEAIRRSNIRVSSGGCGGYPAVWCNAGQDTIVDDWRFWNRECTSWAAWKRYDMGLSPQPYFWGNASQWYSRVTHYSNPSRGDIVVWGEYANSTIGGYGHVAIVESNNGSSVTISEFNFDYGQGPGRFGTRTIPFGNEMLRGAGYIR